MTVKLGLAATLALACAPLMSTSSAETRAPDDGTNKVGVSAYSCDGTNFTAKPQPCGRNQMPIQNVYLSPSMD